MFHRHKWDMIASETRKTYRSTIKLHGELPIAIRTYVLYECECGKIKHEVYEGDFAEDLAKRINRFRGTIWS